MFLEGGWRGLRPPPLGRRNYPKRVILNHFCRVAPSPAFRTEIMLVDKLVKRGCNNQPPPSPTPTPFSKICRSAYDFEFEIERCVFPFSRIHCFERLRGSVWELPEFENREKKETWKELSSRLKEINFNWRKPIEIQIPNIFCFTHILVHDLYIFQPITNKKKWVEHVCLLLLHILLLFF